MFLQRAFSPQSVHWWLVTAIILCAMYLLLLGFFFGIIHFAFSTTNDATNIFTRYVSYLLFYTFIFTLLSSWHHLIVPRSWIAGIIAAIVALTGSMPFFMQMGYGLTGYTDPTINILFNYAYFVLYVIIAFIPISCLVGVLFRRKKSY